MVLSAKIMSDIYWRMYVCINTCVEGVLDLNEMGLHMNMNMNMNASRCRVHVIQH